MQTPLERKVLMGFSAAVALLLFSGSAAWFSATRTTERFAQVDHTHRVLFQIESVLADLLNMQTSARGFLLTGEERFLEPFHAGRAHIQDSLPRLGELIADNPAQQERLRGLNGAADQLLALMNKCIEARRASGFDATAETAILLEGKAAMDRIRSLVGEMQEHERALLAARSAEARREARQTFWVTAVGGTVALSVVGTAVFWVRADLRARLRAEAERDRFFTLSRDLMCIVGFDGYFKRVNPAFTETLGWSDMELLARPFHEFLHLDDRQRTLDEARQQTSGKEVISFENRYLAKDGAVRSVRWNARPIVDARRIYCIGRDVTEEKAAADEIRRLNAALEARATQLEAANAELESFSYSVSHDLRAPLRHAAGFAALLEKEAGAQLDAKSLHYLAVIKQSAAHMGRLIDDLLAFSRAGRTTLQSGAVDHAGLVTDAIRQIGTTAERVNWRVGPLPTLPGDQALLRQVWLNLLDNAVKYTGKSTTPRVEISAQPESGETVFRVRDNGAGFDPRYLPKLFQVFSRLHSAGEFQGTGIGLALVRRIIARHGGRTWAEGAPGGGATFYFSLPVTPIPARNPLPVT